MKMIAVNARGQVIGEDHPKAVLTDHEVGLLIELRDEAFSYGRLSAIFEVSKSCVFRICTGKSRAQTPANYRRARG